MSLSQIYLSSLRQSKWKREGAKKGTVSVNEHWMDPQKNNQERKLAHAVFTCFMKSLFNHFFSPTVHRTMGSKLVFVPCLILSLPCLLCLFMDPIPSSTQAYAGTQAKATVWVQILPLPLSRCATYGNLLNLSVSSIGLLWKLMHVNTLENSITISYYH